MISKVQNSASDHIGAGRIVCGLQYNGSAFHGWQAQKSGVPSVQAPVEKAISRVANEDIKIICAGRTDARVHATGQVIHFDTHSTRNMNAWLKGINTYLPSGICVDWLQDVETDFHARFSATSRRYRYLIYNHDVKPALLSDQLTWNYWTLDHEVMHQAAQSLVGEFDFSSFRASECQAHSPIRTIHYINVSRKQDLIEIDIKANAFLHHMVRNIVGVLLYIGCGKKPIEWVDEVLEAKDRSKGGVTAPPFGLYLVDVEYPEKYGLPITETGPFFLNF